MSQNYYQAALFAKDRTERLMQEAQQHQQVREARQFLAANKQARKLPFWTMRRWASHAHR